MTLCDAVKSRKPFKRPCWGVTITYTDQELFKIRHVREAETVATLELYPEDLLAIDYILIDDLNTNLTNIDL